MLDLEWLRSRCEDTVKSGRLGFHASAEQLLRDVAEFFEEFPEIISQSDCRPAHTAGSDPETESGARDRAESSQRIGQPTRPIVNIEMNKIMS